MSDNGESYEAHIDGFPYQSSEDRPPAREDVEVLLSEFIERQRDGESPTIEEYARKHPRLAVQIREMFPVVAAMELWKRRMDANLLRERLADDFHIQRIADCKIVRELGRGGMGVVFEAHHDTLGLRVAVKLLPWRSETSHHRQRFELEIDTMSRLYHPHIVRILESGIWDGLPFLVMPFIEGVGLDWIIRRLQSESGIVYADEIAALRSLRGRRGSPSAGSARVATDADSYAEFGSPVEKLSPLELPESAESLARSLSRDSWKGFARIGAQAADALAYAHANSIVHRDIKPANLLLDKRGRVWITDFGLANLLSDVPGDNRDDLAGTLRYMAPERFHGQLDARCDIYALGMTLFELTTLHAAYDEPDRAKLVELIAESAPPRPCDLNPSIPVDFEAIILKAIARDPAARYQSAGELLRDLILFMRDRPVSAGTSGWRRQLANWRRYLLRTMLRSKK